MTNLPRRRFLTWNHTEKCFPSGGGPQTLAQSRNGWREEKPVHGKGSPIRELRRMPNEIFDSSLRSSEDWAGVFEFDGNTAYFYLYNEAGEQQEKVAGAIHVLTGVPDFEQQD